MTKRKFVVYFEHHSNIGYVMSKLKECRKRQGLSLQFVSGELGISASHLSRIERGKQVPSPNLAERLSEFFDGEIREVEILYPKRFSQ